MDTQVKDDVLRRLRCVQGHLNGVVRMVEEEQPCPAIMRQTQAVQGALRQISVLLLTHHLDVCLRRAWGEQDMDGYRQLRDELLALLAHKDSIVRKELA